MSDHFPVCLDLRPSVHQSVAKNIEARVGLVVKDKRFPDIDFEEITSNFKVTRLPFLQNYCLTLFLSRLKMFTYFDENRQLTRLEIRWKFYIAYKYPLIFENNRRSQKLSSRSDAVRCLENLREKYEPLVSYSLLASVRHKVLNQDLRKKSHILSPFFSSFNAGVIPKKKFKSFKGSLWSNHCWSECSGRRRWICLAPCDRWYSKEGTHLFRPDQIFHHIIRAVKDVLVIPSACSVVTEFYLLQNYLAAAS